MNKHSITRERFVRKNIQIIFVRLGQNTTLTAVPQRQRQAPDSFSKMTYDEAGLSFSNQELNHENHNPQQDDTQQPIQKDAAFELSAKKGNKPDEEPKGKPARQRQMRRYAK